MAKRFFSTKIWEEDWFLDMPLEYRLFWFYLLSSCDHSGIFKVNLRPFCGLNGVKIDAEKVLQFLNSDKQRVRVVNENTWLIEDFFFYQYGSTFNRNNRVHESIERVYTKYGIKLTSIRGLIDLKDGVKDKDKDKDKESSLVRVRARGGSGGRTEKRGLYFSPEGGFVVFDDDSRQQLTKRELELLKNQQIRPSDILKVDVVSQNRIRRTETAQESPKKKK